MSPNSRPRSRSNSQAPRQPQSQEQNPQPSPQEKLAAAQADAEKWRQVAANPDLSPQAAAVAQNAARSAAAEVRLRQKGLAYQAEQQDQTEAQLAQVLGLSDSPQGQPSPFTTPSPNLSISPGTSASKT